VYQAELLRHHIEALRRLKYRPVGGFALFSFNDPGPVVSFSVLDHERVAKLAYDVVRHACAPVVVIADRPPDFVLPGDDLRLDVHVVNDSRADVDPAVVDIVASWGGGERRWRFGGMVPADECVKVGTISLSIPDTLGALTIELTLTAGDIRATNRYSTAVTVR
jgi:beta-mannosidase